MRQPHGSLEKIIFAIRINGYTIVCPTVGGVCAPAREGEKVSEEDMGGTNRNTGKRKGGKKLLVVSFAIAAVICGVGVYMHVTAESDKEAEEFDYAIRSVEPVISQNYLDKFTGAPEEHRSAIEAHLKELEDVEKEWREASRGKSSTLLEAFMRKHPGSRHRKEALHIMDSLDFAAAGAEDTEEAYIAYLDAHGDGDYYEDAQEGLRRLRAKTVTPDEREMIDNVFLDFFTGISMRDEARLLSTVAERLVLLDKADATRGDVAELLRKLYKENVTCITWQREGEASIKKREIGERSYEYAVSFTAESVTSYTDGDNASSTLRIDAAVNPDGLISEFRMTRIME